MNQIPTSTFEQWLDFGIADMERGDFVSAEGWFQAVLRHDPNHFDGLQLLGLAKVRQRAFGDGIRHLALALQIQPKSVHVLSNLAAAQHEAGLSINEVQTLQRLCEIDSGSLEPQLRLAHAFCRSGQFDAALRLAVTLFQNYPDSAPSAIFLANLLRSRGLTTQAVLVYSKALELTPNDAGLLYDLADTFLVEGDSTAAAECFSRCLNGTDPTLRSASVLGLATARLDLADWADWSEHLEILMQPLRGDERGINPFQPLLVPLTPAKSSAMTQTATRLWVNNAFYEPPVALSPESVPLKTGSLRIAYISPDLWDHPVGRVVAPVVEALGALGHEVLCVSLSRVSDAITERIRRGAAGWLDGAALEDSEVARYLDQADVDLVVDLAGPTAGARPGIFRFRPGRARMSWLGYPGSAGHPDIPYVMSDRETVPDFLAAHFAETVLRLDVPSMTMDGWVDVDRDTARAELGLSTDNIVIGSAARWRKINPTMFWHWVDAVVQVPESVLVLRRPPGDGEARLRDQLADRRLRPGQIRFLDTAPGYDGYLTRLSIFDLALDTYPYGSHSMALEGLRVGTPLLAARGDLMQSRIGAAMLADLGLDEFIVDDIQKYGQRIVDVLREPDTLKKLRRDIKARALARPLLEPAQFALHLEAAYRAVLSHAVNPTGERIIDIALR